VINTPLGRESFFDDRTVRRAAMMHEVPCITTLTGAAAAVSAIRALRSRGSASARCRTTTHKRSLSAA
jgi:carbamoyl-phosphate synthase large subunit